MEKSNEMVTIRPWPPVFPMETLKILEGFNLSAAQQKNLALLKIAYMKKLAILDGEFYDDLKNVIEDMRSRG